MSVGGGRHTRLGPLEEFARLAWQRFAEDGCLSIASSLAFTTLLSLVPIIVVAVTLLSAFPVFETASVRLRAFLLANMDEALDRALAGMRASEARRAPPGSHGVA